ncbi:MAG: helix-turn-helix transcriptional regulator [Gammaproteobacteria bacterium]|nr:helix-turn-helix transcriptional regulator [Gammaproteobacteria bacterium]
MTETTDLLQQILTLGKAQGLTQIVLAQRAGITPESLSRAKKGADMRVSTLNELAHVVGLKLSLVSGAPLREKINSGTLFE